MKSNFCILPWIHSYTDNSGNRRLCCKSNANIGTVDTPLKEFWHGDEMKDIRTRILNNERIDECKSCWISEDKGLISMRQVQTNEWATEVSLKPEAALITPIEDIEVITPQMPFVFLIGAGSLCNLKCRMCGPNNSNLIEKEMKIHFPTEQYFNKTGKEEWFNDQDTRDEMLDIMSNNTYNFIELVGGEPLLNPLIIDFLNSCVKTRISEKTVIKIVTNGTIVSTELLNICEKFYRCKVSFSIDGVEAEQEYIRFPSRWSKVSTNLITVMKYFKDKPHCSMKIGCTVQLFNILNLDKFLLWLEVLKKDHDLEATIGLSILQFPEMYRLEMLPIETRKMIADRLQPFVNSEYLIQQHSRPLSDLVDWLRTHDKCIYDENKDRFWFKSNTMDRVRKQDIKTALPELYNILKNQD